MGLEMSQQEHHKMEIVQTHKNGQDELYCPTCGRRILLQWPPNYKKIVLNPGNEFATHSGGKGGVEIDPPIILEPDEQESIDIENLNPWNEWMNRSNFNRLWD